MDPTEFRRLRAAFERALELPESERQAHLESELGDAPELLAEGARMLGAHSGDEEFLRPPTGETLGQAVGVPNEQFLRPEDRVGDFQLVRPLGGGGMGEVWLARQLRPQRSVALKAMRAGLSTEQARRRFEDEAELLARLSHPGIARVLASGVLEGEPGAQSRPWFALELVENARTITAAASGRSVRERIELLLQACDAIHHGHLRGVLHRDLKPDNVLVDGEGRVRVIDFGIGRAVDAQRERVVRTSEGEMVGTLAYMAPEQVRGEVRAIDVRTDVHALGVLLYELLVGRSPWEQGQSSWTALAKEVLEVDPLPPSRAAAGVERELDWVVARALAKESEQRYASVGELAEDLRRFLRFEPLLAGPPSVGYHARKFVRRNRAVVLGGSVALLLLLLGTAGTLFGLWRSIRRGEQLELARSDAEEKAARATALNNFLGLMLRGSNPMDQLASVTRETSVGEMLDGAADSLRDAFGDRPLLEAEASLLLGMTYHGQGRYETAETHFERAIELYAQGGAEHLPQLFDARRSLAVAIARQGRAEEALELLYASREAAQEQLPAEHPELGRIESDLAWTLQELARWEEALPHAERAVELTDTGAESTAVGHAAAVLNLARTLRGLERMEEAEATYLRAHTLLAEVHGERSPQVGIALSNYGSFLHSEGRVAEAEAPLREASALLRETLEGDHHILGTVLSNLSGVLATLGQLEEAEQLNMEGLAILRAAVGDEHGETANAINSLAFLHCDMGKYASAAVEYAEFAAWLRSTHGDDYWRVHLTEAYRGECVALAGDPDAGEAILEPLYQLYVELEGADGFITRGIARAGQRAFATDEGERGERWRAREG